MLFITHVFGLKDKLLAGQRAITRYIATSDPEGVDFRTSDGLSLSEQEVAELLQNKSVRQLRPGPFPIEPHNALLVNCIGAVYVVDPNYEENRQTMKSIGELLMTDKNLLAA